MKMIEVTFYKNGYEINGHARPEICSEVSIFQWTSSNIIMNVGGGGDYFASGEESSAGYGHFVFDPDNEKAVEVFRVMKKMLPIWADHYKWQEGGHVKIMEKGEMLVIPENFKELKGICA